MEKEVNKISLYQDGGMVDKSNINGALSELTLEIKGRIEAGEEPAQVLASYLEEGIEPDQLNVAFESIGYDPSKFSDLLLSAEEFKQQSQVPQQPQQSMQDPQAEQELMEALGDVEVPQAQVGFETTARGPIDRMPNQGYRPIYSQVYPKKRSLVNAAYMLNDFIGEAENTFSNWKQRNAAYKTKQLANKSYEVDFGENNRDDYAFSLEDLNNGVVKTRDEKAQDLYKYSEFDFNPELNKFTGNYATSQLELDLIPKGQRLEYGQSIPDIVSGIKEKGADHALMVAQTLKNESGVYGKDVVLSYDDNGNPISKVLTDLPAHEIAKHRGRYRQMMTGQNNAEYAPSFTPYSYPTPPKRVTDRYEGVPTEPSIMEKTNADKSILDTSKLNFKDWFIKNSSNPMMAGKSQADLMLMHQSGKYRRGGSLPKAQVMGEFIPDMYKINAYSTPGNFSDYLNSFSGTDYNRDTQIVKDAQLQKANNLGPTPFQQATNQTLQSFIPNDQQTNTDAVETEPSIPTAIAPPPPTVKRKRSIGNAVDQVETFIKDSPLAQAYGDISQGAVMTANFATALTDDTDEIGDMRSQTQAGKMYAVVDPVNARGTQTKNEGFFEPDNKVDYMKKGGEFEPHMMFDPKTGKAYKANEPADHERMKKLGYLHKDEMQEGGEQTPEMKAYLEALEFNKIARQAIGTNDTELLASLMPRMNPDRSYGERELARDFSKLQKLRQAAGLGLKEEASILFPHVGQQLRGGFNQILGTNFEEGGEIEVDNDTLAALIAAGADIEIL